jgi:tetratricopeptide (TPR) repeat protein
MIVVLLPLSSFSINNQLDFTISNQKVKKTGKEIYVSFDLNFQKSEVEKNNYVTLYPIIVSKNDNFNKKIPGFIINGDSRVKAFNRSISIKKEISEEFFRILKNKEIKQGSTFKYYFKTNYADWMEDAKVVLVEFQCGCSGNKPVESESLISDNIEGISPLPLPDFELTYLVPEPETEKKRKITGEASIIFPVNQSVLYKDLANNKDELAKITKSIDEINSTEGAEISGISIQAYASPEGYIQDNIDLSVKRAATLKNYIKSYYGFNEKIFKVSSKGENWEGLVNKLGSTILTDKQKKDILRIIKIEDIKERKLTLKSYESGKPYKYLLQNIFPQLRLSVYTIDYNLPTFTIEKAKELLKTKPALLSLNEMYLLANSFEKGSQDFIDVFDIAVRLYPSDKYANINASSIELKQKNTLRAEKFLSMFEQVPEAYNNIAVMYALKKDFENAKRYFQKAIDYGDDISKNNLERLNNYITNSN